MQRGLLPFLALGMACGSDRGAGTSMGPEQDAAVPTKFDAEVVREDSASLSSDAGPEARPKLCPSQAGSYPAKRETSNVLFLLDRSGSMQIKLSTGDTRWTKTKAGLLDLVANLPATTRAGAMMFPQGDTPITCCRIDTTLNDVKCTCAPGELPGIEARCDAETYTVPVPIQNLTPTHAQAIAQHFSSSDHEFYWGTPLAAALESSVNHLRFTSQLDGTTSVVLFTDGIPTSCDSPTDQDANDIQRVVDAAAAGSGDNVRTFVMGVIDGTKGARAEHLSKIAKAGGTGRTANCELTDSCHYAINAQTFTQDMKAALDQIALQAFDCTFSLPPPPEGGALDLGTVNVQIRHHGGQATLVARDSNHQDGWDTLSNQTHIQLYGPACATMKSELDATVEILVGCKTQGN